MSKQTNEAKVNRLAEQYRERPSPRTLELIVEELYPYLRMRASRIATDPEIQDDLVQDGAVRLLEVIDRFDHGSFMPFVEGFICNHMRHCNRAEMRQQARFLSLNVLCGADAEYVEALEDRSETYEQRQLKELDNEALYGFGEELVGWRDEKIFYERLIAREPKKQSVLAKEFGCSQQQVSLRESALKERLATHMQRMRKVNGL